MEMYTLTMDVLKRDMWVAGMDKWYPSPQMYNRRRNNEHKYKRGK